jgi:hypothetical protein
MTAEQLDQLSRRLHRLEQQNEEILQLLRRLGPGRVRSSEGPPLERKQSRWNGSHWEMFLEGTGWVPDWANHSPAPAGGGK